LTLLMALTLLLQLQHNSSILSRRARGSELSIWELTSPNPCSLSGSNGSYTYVYGLVLSRRARGSELSIWELTSPNPCSLSGSNGSYTYVYGLVQVNYKVQIYIRYELVPVCKSSDINLSCPLTSKHKSISPFRVSP
jgi:hypothetical protein